MPDNFSNIVAVALSDYTTPKVVEDKNKGWVNYGADNDYFQYLIDNYNNSPTNNAIINGMVELIYGGGLDGKNKARKPDEYAMLKNIFSDEDVRRIVTDLKLMGNAASVITVKEGRVKKAEHWPVETLRAEIADDNGDINHYYYHPDWCNADLNSNPEKIKAFRPDVGDGQYIAYIKPYRSGFFYYSPVDYQGCLPYCEVETEVANYHINNIINGFAPSILINFNDGKPEAKVQREIEQKIKSKWGGSSNAGKAIIAFNNDKEQAATLESIPVSDAHSQYQFIADESMKKIMVGHRVTSPMLLGVKDNTGLGNNADELKTASMLFEATVINPFRLIVLKLVDQVLAFNDSSLDVYFKSLDPFKEESRTEETQLSAQMPEATDDQLDDAANMLIESGEEIDEDEWEEVLVKDLIEGENGDEDEFLKNLNDLQSKMTDLSWAEKLARVVSGKPAKTSEQDTSLFKVRYAYAPKTTQSNSRDFCKKMVGAKRVYRKEDIEDAGSLAVNPGLGKGGADTYSIWLYKGGARCHHFWQRLVYIRKNNKKISVNEARRMINALEPSERKDARMETNDKRVATRPIDMPNQGFVKKR